MIARVVMWALALSCCFVVWLLTGMRAMIVVCAMVFFLPLCMILITKLVSDKLSVRIHMPAGPQKGDLTGAWLEVVNDSLLPVARVCVDVRIVNLLTDEQSVFPVSCSVPPRSCRRVEFDFATEYCGRFHFSVVRLLVFDCWGLVGWPQSTAVREKRTVLPETFPMTVHLSGNETPLGDNILNLNRKGQDYSEPFQIRDYVEGDSLKQIHWKLTQKYDKYIVTDPSVALERALLVFWDKSVACSPKAADTLAEAMLSFCLALAEDEVPYSLAVGVGETPIQDITSVDDIYGMIHHLLRSQEQVNGIPELLQLLGGRQYPLIALFTSHITKDIGLLAAAGAVTVFLYSETDDAAGAGDLRQYVFSSADYKTTLRDVTI